MEKRIKAGTIFINVNDKTVAIVHREKQNDYSFPKGRLEYGETIKECAIRETEEETKHKCILLCEDPIFVEKYVSPNNEDVSLYYFLAKDGGESENDSHDTHPTIWCPYDEVIDILSNDSLKNVWISVKNIVDNHF